MRIKQKGYYLKSFRDIKLANGVTIGIFQGNRGSNPELDIIVKYQEPDKRIRTPKHIHWAIDLLIKKSHSRELTISFVEFLLSMWASVRPFSTKAEQQACVLQYTSSNRIQEFSSLNKFGEYSIEFTVHILELIMIQEKTGYPKAFMFKKVLEALKSENSDIFAVVSAASYSG